MALDTHTKEVLLSVFRTPEARDIVVAAIDSNGSGPAAAITALGTTANLTAIAATYADLAAARTSVNTLRTDTEARLDAIESKLDALIAALKTAGMMTT